MRQRMKPTPGHVLVKRSKNGRRELQIKNLQPEHLQMLFNQDVTLIIQENENSDGPVPFMTSMSERMYKN